MKSFKLKSLLATIGILLLALLFLGSCTKKEAPSAPTNLEAVLDGDCIHLSWKRVPNTDYYRITVGFQTRDSYNVLADIYEIFLCETSDHTYNDLYPFDGMNYYKIEAVNEYGSSPCSEISCDYSYHGVGVHSCLYPNPTMGQVCIEAYCVNHITVTDLLGNMFFEWEGANSGSFTIDVSQYNPGIYLIHINSEEGEEVKRFAVVNEL